MSIAKKVDCGIHAGAVVVTVVIVVSYNQPAAQSTDEAAVSPLSIKTASMLSSNHTFMLIQKIVV